MQQDNLEGGQTQTFGQDQVVLLVDVERNEAIGGFAFGIGQSHSLICNVPEDVAYRIWQSDWQSLHPLVHQVGLGPDGELPPPEVVASGSSNGRWYSMTSVDFTRVQYLDFSGSTYCHHVGMNRSVEPFSASPSEVAASRPSEVPAEVRNPGSRLATQKVGADPLPLGPKVSRRDCWWLGVLFAITCQHDDGF